MIKVEELKRNNYLFQKSRGIAVQIDNPRGLHLITAWGVDWPIEDFDPIPLTPEWLERLGFIDDLPWAKGNFRVDSENRFHVVDGTGYSVIVARNIEYVHQLQNLYFALTGEELTIKETV